MASLQYVIDTICSSLSVNSVYEIFETRLKQGSFTVAEILSLIQSKDRSLDVGSAMLIAGAALGELERSGRLRMERDTVYPTGKK
jgi:hypothetical protein